MDLLKKIKAWLERRPNKAEENKPLDISEVCYLRGVLVHTQIHSGTGILLDSAYILTAQHVANASGAYSITSAAGQPLGFARRLAANKGADIALLCLKQPVTSAVHAIKLADALPSHGDRAWFFSGRRGGVVTSRFAENRKKTPWQGLTHDSMPGDSGSGVLNAKGELVTCIGGNLKLHKAKMSFNGRGLQYSREKTDSTYGPDISSLRAFLAENWPLYENETPA